MFYSRYADALRDEWAALEPLLLARPKLGRYIAFNDYPQADHTRLALAAAKKRYPQLGTREAVRRIARDDFSTFAASMIGKVMLSLAGDARTTLLAAPGAFERVTTGLRVTTHALDPRTVRLEFKQYHGMWEYTLGQLEGVVLHYGATALTTVRSSGANHVMFDVT